MGREDCAVGSGFTVETWLVLELGSGNSDVVFGHNATRTNHILFIFTTLEIFP